MGEDLIKVSERIASVMKGLESIGRLQSEVESVIRSKVRLGEIHLASVPQFKLKLARERPLDDTTIGRLHKLLWGESVKLWEVGLETYEIQREKRMRLFVAIGEAVADASYYEVEFEKSGPVTARLIDLLALAALDEEDWRAIAERLEKREAALREMLERLKNALAALEIVLG